MVASVNVSLRATATVQGIGPLFRMNIKLQNTSPGLLTGVTMSINTDESMYDVGAAVISAGLLVPGVPYTFSTTVKCLTEEPVSGTVRVFVSHPPNPVPLITVVVDMPVAEGVETVR